MCARPLPLPPAQKADLYTLLASEVFSKPAPVITPDERQAAKTVCLGIMYGIGSVEASKKLGVTEPEARRLKARFLQRCGCLYLRFAC